MEEVKRLARHIGPVAAVYIVASWGLPAEIEAPLTAFLGQFAEVAVAVVAGAVGYVWSLWRDWQGKDIAKGKSK